MTEIVYDSDVRRVRPGHLAGFFVGWPNPPSAEVHLRLLRSSSAVVLAWDGDAVVGYVTAMSDGVLFSSISSVEVLPEFQGRGIGRELMRRVLELLADIYATDLVCDESVAPFYEGLGIRRLVGMGVRRYERQSGPND